MAAALDDSDVDLPGAQNPGPDAAAADDPPTAHGGGKKKRLSGFLKKGTDKLKPSKIKGLFHKGNKQPAALPPPSALGSAMGSFSSRPTSYDTQQDEEDEEEEDEDEEEVDVMVAAGMPPGQQQYPMSLAYAADPDANQDKDQMSPVAPIGFSPYFQPVAAAAPPVPEPPGPDRDLSPVKPFPEPSIWNMGTFLIGLSIVFVIIGIFLTAFGGRNATAKVLGPIFLVLGGFYMLGQAYYYLVWEDNFLPDWFVKTFDKIDGAIGGVKDPYGFEKPAAVRAQYNPIAYNAAPYFDNPPPRSPVDKESVALAPLGYTQYPDDKYAQQPYMVHDNYMEDKEERNATEPEPEGAVGRPHTMLPYRMDMSQDTEPAGRSTPHDL